MIKTRWWIAGIAVLLAACLLMNYLLLGKKAEGTVANVYQGSNCVLSMDLSLVEEPLEYTFVSAGGITNTIRFEKGRVCMAGADCPDRICVDTGWIGDSAQPVVCLPAGLVIRVEKDNAYGIDTVIQ